MGATGYYTDKPTRQLITELLTYDNDLCKCEVVDAATVGEATYLAWRKTYHPDSGDVDAGKTYVMAIVVEHHRAHGETIIRECGETGGPVHRDCPARILDKLSPIEDFTVESTGDFNPREWATKWRADCRARIAKVQKAPGNGAIIKFAKPIKFVSGDVIDTFKIKKTGRKIRFSRVDEEFYVYSISGWQQRDYEILPN